MSDQNSNGNGTEPDHNFAIFTTVPKRPTIEIDETRYDLAMLDYDFSLGEHHQLDRDIAEFNDLWAQKKLSKQDEKRLNVLLESLFQRVSRIPDEVAAKLHPVQKRQVIAVFSFAPALMQAAAEKKETAREIESTTAS